MTAAPSTLALLVEIEPDRLGYYFGIDRTRLEYIFVFFSFSASPKLKFHGVPLPPPIQRDSLDHTTVVS